MRLRVWKRPRNESRLVVSRAHGCFVVGVAAASAFASIGRISYLNSLYRLSLEDFCASCLCSGKGCEDRGAVFARGVNTMNKSPSGLGSSTSLVNLSSASLGASVGSVGEPRVVVTNCGTDVAAVPSLNFIVGDSRYDLGRFADASPQLLSIVRGAVHIQRRVSRAGRTGTSVRLAMSASGDEGLPSPMSVPTCKADAALASEHVVAVVQGVYRRLMRVLSPGDHVVWLFCLLAEMSMHGVVQSMSPYTVYAPSGARNLDPVAFVSLLRCFDAGSFLPDETILLRVRDGGGVVDGQSEHVGHDAPTWISPGRWRCLSHLAASHGRYRELCSDIVSHARSWKSLVTQKRPFVPHLNFPGKWKESLSLIEKVTIMMILSGARAMSVFASFVAAELGPEFVAYVQGGASGATITDARDFLRKHPVQDTTSSIAPAPIAVSGPGNLLSSARASVCSAPVDSGLFKALLAEDVFCSAVEVQRMSPYQPLIVMTTPENDGLEELCMILEKTRVWSALSAACMSSVDRGPLFSTISVVGALMDVEGFANAPVVPQQGKKNELQKPKTSRRLSVNLGGLDQFGRPLVNSTPASGLPPQVVGPTVDECVEKVVDSERSAPPCGMLEVLGAFGHAAAFEDEPTSSRCVGGTRPLRTSILDATGPLMPGLQGTVVGCRETPLGDVSGTDADKEVLMNLDGSRLPRATVSSSVAAAVPDLSVSRVLKVLVEGEQAIEQQMSDVEEAVYRGYVVIVRDPHSRGTPSSLVFSVLRMLEVIPCERFHSSFRLICVVPYGSTVLPDATAQLARLVQLRVPHGLRSRVLYLLKLYESVYTMYSAPLWQRVVLLILVVYSLACERVALTTAVELSGDDGLASGADDRSSMYPLSVLRSMLGLAKTLFEKQCPILLRLGDLVKVNEDGSVHVANGVDVKLKEHEADVAKRELLDGRTRAQNVHESLTKSPAQHGVLVDDSFLINVCVKAQLPNVALDEIAALCTALEDRLPELLFAGSPLGASPVPSVMIDSIWCNRSIIQRIICPDVIFGRVPVFAFSLFEHEDAREESAPSTPAAGAQTFRMLAASVTDVGEGDKKKTRKKSTSGAVNVFHAIAQTLGGSGAGRRGNDESDLAAEVMLHTAILNARGIGYLSNLGQSMGDAVMWVASCVPVTATLHMGIDSEVVHIACDSGASMVSSVIDPAVGACDIESLTTEGRAAESKTEQQALLKNEATYSARRTERLCMLNELAKSMCLRMSVSDVRAVGEHAFNVFSSRLSLVRTPSASWVPQDIYDTFFDESPIGEAAIGAETTDIDLLKQQVAGVLRRTSSLVNSDIPAAKELRPRLSVQGLAHGRTVLDPLGVSWMSVACGSVLDVRLLSHQAYGKVADACCLSMPPSSAATLTSIVEPLRRTASPLDAVRILMSCARDALTTLVRAAVDKLTCVMPPPLGRLIPWYTALSSSTGIVVASECIAYDSLVSHVENGAAGVLAYMEGSTPGWAGIAYDIAALLASRIPRGWIIGDKAILTAPLPSVDPSITAWAGAMLDRGAYFVQLACLSFPRIASDALVADYNALSSEWVLGQEDAESSSVPDGSFVSGVRNLAAAAAVTARFPEHGLCDVPGGLFLPAFHDPDRAVAAALVPGSRTFMSSGAIVLEVVTIVRVSDIDAVRRQEFDLVQKHGEDGEAYVDSLKLPRGADGNILAQYCLAVDDKYLEAVGTAAAPLVDGGRAVQVADSAHLRVAAAASDVFGHVESGCLFVSGLEMHGALLNDAGVFVPEISGALDRARSETGRRARLMTDSDMGHEMGLAGRGYEGPRLSHGADKTVRQDAMSTIRGVGSVLDSMGDMFGAWVRPVPTPIERQSAVFDSSAVRGELAHLSLGRLPTAVAKERQVARPPVPHQETSSDSPMSATPDMMSTLSATTTATSTEARHSPVSVSSVSSDVRRKRRKSVRIDLKSMGSTASSFNEVVDSEPAPEAGLVVRDSLLTRGVSTGSVSTSATPSEKAKKGPISRSLSSNSVRTKPVLTHRASVTTSIAAGKAAVAFHKPAGPTKQARFEELELKEKPSFNNTVPHPPSSDRLSGGVGRTMGKLSSRKRSKSVVLHRITRAEAMFVSHVHSVNVDCIRRVSAIHGAMLTPLVCGIGVESVAPSEIVGSFAGQRGVAAVVGTAVNVAGDVQMLWTAEREGAVGRSYSVNSLGAGTGSKDGMEVASLDAVSDSSRRGSHALGSMLRRASVSAATMAGETVVGRGGGVTGSQVRNSTAPSAPSSAVSRVGRCLTLCNVSTVRGLSPVCATAVGVEAKAVVAAPLTITYSECLSHTLEGGGAVPLPSERSIWAAMPRGAEMSHYHVGERKDVYDARASICADDGGELLSSQSGEVLGTVKNNRTTVPSEELLPGASPVSSVAEGVRDAPVPAAFISLEEAERGGLKAAYPVGDCALGIHGFEIGNVAPSLAGGGSDPTSMHVGGVSGPSSTSMPCVRTVMSAQRVWFVCPVNMSLSRGDDLGDLPTGLGDLAGLASGASGVALLSEHRARFRLSRKFAAACVPLLGLHQASRAANVPHAPSHLKCTTNARTDRYTLQDPGSGVAGGAKRRAKLMAAVQRSYTLSANLTMDALKAVDEPSEAALIIPPSLPAIRLACIVLDAYPSALIRNRVWGDVVYAIPGVARPESAAVVSNDAPTIVVATLEASALWCSGTDLPSGASASRPVARDPTAPVPAYIAKLRARGMHVKRHRSLAHMRGDLSGSEGVQGGDK